MTERERRGSSAARGYGSRWQKARRAFLAGHSTCVLCERLDRLTIATVVDHVVPHKGDQRLFWDQENWQALCKSCHDKAKRLQERTGRLPGCTDHGLPLDPGHGWRA